MGRCWRGEEGVEYGWDERSDCHEERRTYGTSSILASVGKEIHGILRSWWSGLGCHFAYVEKSVSLAEI